MRTTEELNKLKEEYEALTEKLSDLSEEELELVTGGTVLSNPATEIHFVPGD